MRFRNASPEKGFTMVEVLIAMAVLVIVGASLAQIFGVLQRQTTANKDKTFATEKAVQMMEELRGLIENTANATIGILDDYDDGSNDNYVLTSKKDVTDPGDLISNNAARKFFRRISVLTIPNETYARRVYVRVYDAETSEALAETVSVLRTTVGEYVPTQVFDIYVLTIENVPGWWSALSTLRPTFDSVVQDIQTRNPNLELRVHYITRLSYGRDPFYTPYLNAATASNALTPANMSVYYYPGSSWGHTSGAPFDYYTDTYMRGRTNIDGTTQTTLDYPQNNQYGSSIADQHNHAVRYPDEVALYNQAVADSLAAGQGTPEISLRMLWEKMNSAPQEMRNSLIINLHGELLPMPPMRNYSDPAWSRTAAYERMVAHPENIRYPVNGVVKIRCYSFLSTGTWASAGAMGALKGVETSTMSILFTSTAIYDTSNISVRKLVGNSTWTAAGNPYHWCPAASGTDYSVTYPSTGSTLIVLFNTPLMHGTNSNSKGGLSATYKLYGLEYIPSLVANATSFVEGKAVASGWRDLATHTSTDPVNTARWVIALSRLTTGQYAFETRIGSDTTTGTSTYLPENLSRSYVWVSTEPPVTEQYQFMGDPRHMPFADVKVSTGYNVYFSTVNTSDWPAWNAISGANALWNSAMNFDIPRFFQVLRTGLMRSGSIWNSITGYSFYYTGVGGEMGDDGSIGFPSSLQIVQTPWVPTGTAVTSVNEIINAYTQPYARLIVQDAGGNSWWGRYWIGELFPDISSTTWIATGNLPVGAGNYYRGAFTKAGVAQSQKRTNTAGCSSFFNGNPSGNSATTFQHRFPGAGEDTANITSTGTAISSDFNFSMLTSMSAARPFRLNDTSGFSPEWNSPLYNVVRTTLTTQEIIYDPQIITATHDSSAVITVATSAVVGKGRAVVNGLSAQGNFGSAQIAKLCVITMLRGYLSAGMDPSATGRIAQVPLLSLTTPTATSEMVNPSTVTIIWVSSWTRWDSQKYTSHYPNNFTETVGLTYNVKYSNDNGTNWYYVQDNAAASKGVRGGGVYAISGTTQYTWDISNATTFPQGSYLIMVEAYRDGLPLHYTYHQVRIYVKR